jgi:hypothetical protein
MARAKRKYALVLAGWLKEAQDEATPRDRLDAIAEEVLVNDLVPDDVERWRKEIMQALLENPGTGMWSVLRMGAFFPGEVLRHPMLEAWAWEDAFQFDDLKQWGQELAIHPDFPPLWEMKLYNDLVPNHSSKESDWFSVEGKIAERVTLPWEMVRLWVSQLVHSPYVYRFFLRGDAKGRERELLEVFLAAPQYPADSHEATFEAFMELMRKPELAGVWTDEDERLWGEDEEEG